MFNDYHQFIEEDVFISHLMDFYLQGCDGTHAHSEKYGLVSPIVGFRNITGEEVGVQPQELLSRIEERVLWLTLDRPHCRNALSPTLYSSLLDALVQAQSNDAVGAVVLSGAGGAFCAGGDVKRMSKADSQTLTPQERETALRLRTRIVELLHDGTKPTIALIQGPAVGAGLSLALACDLRFGDLTARLCTGFGKVGLSGDFGSHYFLPRIVGPAKARELFFLSPVLTANEACELGLLNAVIDPEQLSSTVGDIAVRIASGPQPAMALIKANLNDAEQLSLAEILDLEAARHVQCTESDDHKEAVQAYLGKRDPKFKWLWD